MFKKSRREPKCRENRQSQLIIFVALSIEPHRGNDYYGIFRSTNINSLTGLLKFEILQFYTIRYVMVHISAVFK